MVLWKIFGKVFITKKFTQCKILMLQFPIPRASLSSSRSLSNLILADWNSSLTKYSHVLHRFPYFALPHSTTDHHKYCICQTISHAKQVKFYPSPLQLLFNKILIIFIGFPNLSCPIRPHTTTSTVFSLIVLLQVKVGRVVNSKLVFTD